MLETPHTKEYYLAKAEDEPFVKEALEGTATFRGRLDDLVGGVTGREGAPPASEHAEENFKAYLTVLEDISSAGLDVKGLSYSGSCMSLYGTGQAVSGFFMGIGALGVIGLVIPPIAVIEGVALCAGGCLGWMFGKETRKYKGLRDRADEIFAPAYAAADAVDGDISKCFPHGRPLEACHPLSEDEEKIYSVLGEKGRQAVEEDLRRRLAIGALDMSEVDLDRYLAGLAEKRDEKRSPSVWETTGGGRLD